MGHVEGQEALRPDVGPPQPRARDLTSCGTCAWLPEEAGRFLDALPALAAGGYPFFARRHSGERVQDRLRKPPCSCRVPSYRQSLQGDGVINSAPSATRTGATFCLVNRPCGRRLDHLLGWSRRTALCWRWRRVARSSVDRRRCPAAGAADAPGRIQRTPAEDAQRCFTSFLPKSTAGGGPVFGAAEPWDHPRSRAPGSSARAGLRRPARATGWVGA